MVGLSSSLRNPKQRCPCWQRCSKKFLTLKRNHNSSVNGSGNKVPGRPPWSLCKKSLNIWFQRYKVGSINLKCESSAFLLEASNNQVAYRDTANAGPNKHKSWNQLMEVVSMIVLILLWGQIFLLGLNY